MSKHLYFAYPGDLTAPTGGYGYDREIIAGLRQSGWLVHLITLGEGFPFPDQSVRETAQQALLRIPAGATVVIDGLAFGVLAETAATMQHTHAMIALVHHPLALESGLDDLQISHLTACERTALAYAKRVIVTSPATARLLTAHYDVLANRIDVICPGTAKATPARGSQDGVVHLLSVGSLIERKGFDILIAALATMTDTPWHLTIAGDCQRDSVVARTIESDISRLNLNARVSRLGAVSASTLAQLYDESDVFVLASRLEGYGMAYAEAIAHGLPVIGTTAGAIPDTVPAECGLLVPPDDVFALSLALRRLIQHPAERQRLARGARQVARYLPTWADSTRQFAQTLESIISR